MANIECYSVEIITPGIVIDVPESKEILRSPLKKLVRMEHIQLWESLIILKGISNYKITTVEVDEEELAIKTGKSTNMNVIKKLGEGGIKFNLLMGKKN